MAYTKYSLTPANNNAAPPDGAPEGMLPSAVNDTMRDMMAQIRDVGDGIRGGTYTMTAPVITGGSITGVALSGNTLTNPVITGGSINNTPIGASTANTGAFTTLGATGVATFSAGTVSAPAITTTGDTNTGIFFPAADTIAFTEGGVESMRIDSSGNVGIGTSSPSRKLSVAGSMGADNYYVDVAAGAFGLPSDTSIEMYGASSAQIMVFKVNGNTERMRITSGGDLLAGKTVTGQVLTKGFEYSNVSGAEYLSICTTTAGNTALWVSNIATSGTRTLVNFYAGSTAVGSITSNGTGVTYGTNSDYRLKENIVPMTGALAKVAQLKPVTYTWKIDGSSGQGFIAHELQAVVPDCVTGEKDAIDAEGKPVYQGIDTSFLVATLTKAIQEQQALITQLQADVALLKGN